MSQTFAPGYVEPGTYVEVTYQQTPNIIVPPFVTALIGRTSASKPATDELIRNAAVGTEVYLNTAGAVLTASDVDETIRRDYLDTYDDVSNDSGVLAITSVVDSLSTQHLKGSSETWVPFNSGTTAADKVYIEWVAKYYVTKAATGDEIFAGSMTGGQLVSIAGVTQEDREVEDVAFADQTTAITAAEGDHDAGDTGGLVLTNTAGTYTLTWDGGVASTGFVAGTSIIECVLENAATDESIKVLVDTSKVAALGLTTGLSFTNNVKITTAGPASGTSIVAGTYSAGNHGIKYTVTYSEPKTAADFAATRFDDITALQAFHGAITSTMQNDYLSVGATPYFIAGGGPVWAVPLKDKVITGTSTDPDLTNDSGYVEAIRLALILLESVSEVGCIVPLSPTEPSGNGNFRPDIMGLVKSHVINMSGTSMHPCKSRMGFLGGVANETNESVFIAAAEAGGSNRIVYVAPATATLNAGGYAFTADGSTMAAGLAGICSRPDINAGEPISGKSFDMFADVDDRFTRTQKNRMAAAGITIIEKDGATKVRHFLTTDQSNPLLAEAKITRIEMDYRRSIQTALDAVMINTRFVPGSTVGTIKSLIAEVSNLKKAAQIIVDYNISKVAVNALEPRQIDVVIAILPVFDANWIFVEAEFRISLS